MKYYFRYILLFLWLFALAAPSVLTLLDPDKPVIVMNLNEEEQQEVLKKVQDEEKIVDYNYFALFTVLQIEEKTFSDNGSFFRLGHTLEILLPPPELRG